jgi:hypothetical protein
MQIDPKLAKVKYMMIICDGASPFAGYAMTRACATSKEACGVATLSLFRGVAGFGKGPVDGNFAQVKNAVNGGVVRGKGKLDVTNAAQFATNLSSNMPDGNSVLCLKMDRTEKHLKTLESKAGLAGITDSVYREFELDENDRCTAIILRYQHNDASKNCTCEGKRIERASFVPLEGTHPAATIVRLTKCADMYQVINNDAATSVGDHSSTRLKTAARKEKKDKCNLNKVAAFHRELDFADTRRIIRSQKFSCCDDEDGEERCSDTFDNEAEVAKHVKSALHHYGDINNRRKSQADPNSKLQSDFTSMCLEGLTSATANNGSH